MRPPVVVVHPPLVENDPSLWQAQEQLTVEELIPKPHHAKQLTVAVYLPGTVPLRAPVLTVPRF